MADPETIGWLVFVERLVGHLAWPTAVVVSVVLFRTQIVRAISRLKTIRHKDTEITFSELLEEASQEAQTLRSEKAVLDASKIDRKLISGYPHLAVLESWRRVENSVAEIVAVQWPRLPERDFHGLSGIRNLERLEVVDNSVLRLLNDLRRVRNTAVHGYDGDITEGQALEFVSLATRVEAELEQARKKVPKDD